MEYGVTNFENDNASNFVTDFSGKEMVSYP